MSKGEVDPPAFVAVVKKAVLTEDERKFIDDMDSRYRRMFANVDQVTGVGLVYHLDTHRSLELLLDNGWKCLVAPVDKETTEDICKYLIRKCSRMYADRIGRARDLCCWPRRLLYNPAHIDPAAIPDFFTEETNPVEIRTNRKYGVESCKKMHMKTLFRKMNAKTKNFPEFIDEPIREEPVPAPVAVPEIAVPEAVPEVVVPEAVPEVVQEVVIPNDEIEEPGMKRSAELADSENRKRLRVGDSSFKMMAMCYKHMSDIFMDLASLQP